jgi:PAS domain-containing protein
VDSPERQARDRIGSALNRVALLERAVQGGEIKTNLQKLSLELRRIGGDLERALVQVDDADASRREMQMLGDAAQRRAKLVFALSPTPCFVLDRTGKVLDANPAAVRAVNTSLRYLVGRDFQVFVCSERLRFLSQLQSLDAAETPSRWPLTIRPRERGTKQFQFSSTVESENRLLLMLFADSEDGVVSHTLLETRRPRPPGTPQLD